jgi:beta-phosphoglucomutase-like phosphatase (HAD superfamily)
MSQKCPSFFDDLADCRSLVFDVDGTLVCSEPIIQRTILTTVVKYLTPEAALEFDSHISTIRSELFGYSEDIFTAKLFSYLCSRSMLVQQIARLDSAAFFQLFSNDRQEQYIRFCQQGLATPMPGVVPFVQEAYERFGALALNTGSPDILARPMLQHVFNGLLDTDCIFPHRLRTYVNDLPLGLGKPNPDGYLRASRLLGIPPWELGAVVDRGNDCISALRAGYRKVVLVPENRDRAPLDAATGKHSLVQFLSSVPEIDRAALHARVMIIDSLSDIDLTPLPEVA